MSLIGNLFRSSIGRKFLMAVTGLILVGFIVGHLIGNLQIFSHPDKINGYAQFLQSLGPLLWTARIGLLVAVGIHIWAAVVLTLENQRARGAQRYGVKKWIRASVSSRYMRWTGFVVLGFIIYHLAQFTLGLTSTADFKSNLPEYTMTQDFHLLGFPAVEKGRPVHDVYSMVFMSFQQPVVALFYIIAIGLLTMHLLHGFQSAFQTFGWRNASWASVLRTIAFIFCIAYFLGNIAMPGAILTGILKPAAGTYAAEHSAARATARVSAP